MWNSELVDIEVARYAIRTFEIRRYSGEVWSVSQGPGHWKDGVCKAECLVSRPVYDWQGMMTDFRMRSHPAPQLGCSCGAYGALSLESLRSQYATLASRVIAVMAAEGSTVIGPRGLRTAYARIVAWWSPFRDTDTKRVCAPNFPDAKRFMLLDNMLRAYHIPVKQEIPEGKIALGYRGGYWA